MCVILNAIAISINAAPNGYFKYVIHTIVIGV